MARKKKDEGVGMPLVDQGMNKKMSGSIEPPNTAKESAEDKARDVDRKLTKAEEKKILDVALKRFKKCVEAESENRAKALEDLKFKAGDQWPADIRNQRNNDKRPCLTINKIPTLTHQISNDLRQNRPAINISPVGDKADKEAAKAYAGLINAIERDCQADIAYDTAMTSAVDIGFGFVRVLTEYESDDSFNQTIVIKRVRNPFTIYLDPDRQEPDGADARYGFVTEMISRDEFKDKYPDAYMMPWTERAVGDEQKEWLTKDSVRIAEYFAVEHEMKTLVQLSTGHVGFWDDLSDEIKAEIEDGKIEILNKRQSEKQKVIWRKITALEVLEEKPWAGRWIPIVEFIGEEIDLQGKIIRSGVIRNAKDSQRQKNYWATAKTEMVALAPKAPWVIAEGQIEGYEQEWKQANVKSMPVLTYVPTALGDKPVPPPQRSPMVGVPEGIVQAEMSSEQDLMATTGVRFDSTAQDRMYDESGKAIKEIRRSLDIGSFHFMDNGSRSIRHIGRILVDLIPKIIDTKRVVTILREDDTEERITLDPNAPQPFMRNPSEQQMHSRKIFNPTIGQYGVTVTIGPSYATKRIEASEQMMKFAQALPQQGAMIAHLIAKYSDWPGSDEAYRILTKALPPNLLTPDIRDLPPQLATFVQSLTQQISQLAAERVQMLRDLTDQRADRAVKQDKIHKDFEAKLLKILMDGKTKMVELTREDVMQAVALTDEGLNQQLGLPEGAQMPPFTQAGTSPQNPNFPNNQPVLPVSPVGMQ